MKNIKKLASVLLALVMTLALAIPAFATANDASITIKSDAPEGSTQDQTEYTYYKILDADIKSVGDVDEETGELTTDPGIVSYYVTTQTRADALTGTGLFKAEKSASGDRWYITLIDSTTSASTIAEKLGEIKSNFENVGTATMGEDGTVTKDNLAPGYYLIESSLGTKLAVQTLADVTIKEKNDYPTNTKEADVSTVSTGQTVTYTVEVAIPESVQEKDIKVVDTITKGLTMNTAITVTGGVEGTPATLTFEENTAATGLPEGSKQYIATIPAATVIANKGKTLTLTYTATVNDQAVVNEPETNKAHIEYDHYVGKDIDVNVVPHGFTVKKIDGNDVTEGMTDADKAALTALTGAEFSLWSAETGGEQIALVKLADGIYRPATAEEKAAEGFTSAVIEAGEATINGLADGTYYLQEDKAPEGYNELTARVQVTVSADTAAVGVDLTVANNQGTQLPSTGGIGTTIFYIAGGVLVLAAIIVLIAKRRAGTDD